MRLLLAFALLFFPFNALSNEQFTQRKCDELKEEKEYIRKRFNAGYGVAEGNYLNKRDREIFMLMSAHCRNPLKETQRQIYYSDRPAPQNQAITQPRRLPKSSYTIRNNVYTPEKSAAWDAFYQVPSRCRSKDTSQEDFVFCAENKAQQKREFEKQWRSGTP